MTGATDSFLLNGKSGQPEGVGAILGVNNASLPGMDNLFQPGETLTVIFEIAIGDPQGSFDVAMYATEVDTVGAASQVPLATGTIEFPQVLQEVDEEEQVSRIFLPLVNR